MLACDELREQLSVDMPGKSGLWLLNMYSRGVAMDLRKRKQKDSSKHLPTNEAC